MHTIGTLQERIRKLEEENTVMRELIDGATVTVQLFKADFPFQAQWKAVWLNKARRILGEVNKRKAG